MREVHTALRRSDDHPNLRRGLGRLLVSACTRIYAVGLIVVVLWLSWKAFLYLVSALIFPASAPPQIVDLPRRLDERALARPGLGFAGVNAAENPRGPLSHYHRLDFWFEPETANGCTRVGCHAPLPHGKNKADRAFLNMHATSIHCGVCHMKTEANPLPLVWYDMKTGRVQDPPALLRAYAWLMENRGKDASEFTDKDQKRVVKLIRKAARATHRKEPVLEHLADHLAAVRVHSDRFATLIQVATDTVPKYFRGEYGAKLALFDPESKQPRIGPEGDEEIVQRFLKQGDQMGSEERQNLLLRIHPARREPTLRCEQCHRAEGSLMDLAAAGYPEARVEVLVHALIIQMIDNIRQGRPFHMFGALGSLLGGPGGSPAGSRDTPAMENP